MSANPFDQASRYLAKLDPPAFLAWLLRLALSAFVFRRWLDTRLIRFPGEPDRACDTVAFLEDVAAGGAPWATVLEFQIEPDPLMFGRLLGYFGPLWLELKPSPERGDRFHLGAVVVNLTGRGDASRDMAWPGTGLETRLKVVERNLSTYAATTVLDEVAAGTAPAVALPLIPLMRGGDEPGIIERWKELAGREANPRRRADYGGLALVFAEAGDRRDVWKSALKEWNVIQSQQVQEWQEQARIEARAEARIESRVETLLEVLHAHFGILPAELPDRLRAVRDEAHWKRLAASAHRASSLEEFLRELQAG